MRGSWNTNAMAAAEEATLANGLRVVVLPFRDWPVAATLVSYRAGSLHEPEGCAGIAHLMEHMMFRGTERFPGGAIDELTARLGGINNAVTTTDYAAYYFALPGPGWRTALEIEADRMEHCRIDRDVLEIERKVALEERRMAADDPESMLDEALDTFMFGDHAYGRPVMGVMETIARLTADDLRAFYRDRYVPGNASIIVVGGVAASEVFDMCGELFESIARGPEEMPVSARALPRRDGGSERLAVDRSTPRVALGFATPEATHADSPALELLVSLLASGRSSRLYDSLVRRGRFATEVSCSRLLQREPGIFTLATALHPGSSPESAKEAMLDVLSDVATHTPDDEEFEKARRLARADLAAAHDTALGAAATLGLWEAIDTWREGLRFEELLEQVRAEDLRRVAATYLDSEAVTSVTLHPRANQGHPRPEDRA